MENLQIYFMYLRIFLERLKNFPEYCIISFYKEEGSDEVSFVVTETVFERSG